MFNCAIKRVALLFVLKLYVLLTACAQGDFSYHANSVNRAFAKSQNKQILLNAVRASVDRPMHFTPVTEYVGGKKLTGEFDPSLPFGGDATNVFSLGPKLTFSNGLSSLKFQFLNNHAAYTGLTTPINFVEVHKYFNSGQGVRLVATILFQWVGVHKELYFELIQNYRTKCGRSDDYRCSYLKRVENDTGELETAVHFVKFSENDQYASFGNNGQSRREHKQFQSMLNLLSLADYATEDVPSSDPKKEKPIIKMHFGNRHINSIARAIDARLSSKDEQAISFRFRSPRDVVEYLGRLIALQNYSSPRYVPRIQNSLGREVALFRVIEGRPAEGEAAVSVYGPRGNVFWIPEPDFSSPNRDLSLRVLGLTNELLARAFSPSGLQTGTVTSITVN